MEKIKNLKKQGDYLHQIARASAAIRRKHKILKTGRDDSERAINEVFKPVVMPLQKLIDQSENPLKTKKDKKKKKKDDRVKKEEERKEEEFDATFATAYGDDDEEEEEGQTLSIPENVFREEPSMEQHATTSRAATQFDLQKYLKMFETNDKKNLDTSYGVRKLSGNNLMIGDSPVSFGEHTLTVKNSTHALTPGLLELIFKKQPDKDIVTASDIDNYATIVTNTNAYRKFYKSDQPVREEKSHKYKNIIEGILMSQGQRRKLGKAISLPKNMIVTDRKMDYVFWDDPNELVERLRLLLASQAAGNNSHTNEIMSIIEELREKNIIY